MSTVDPSPVGRPVSSLQAEPGVLNQDPEHWRLAGFVFFGAFTAACALAAAADGVVRVAQREHLREHLRAAARAFHHFDEDKVVGTFDAYVADALAGGDRRRRVELRVARVACDRGAVHALRRLCRAVAAARACGGSKDPLADLDSLLDRPTPEPVRSS